MWILIVNDPTGKFVIVGVTAKDIKLFIPTGLMDPSKYRATEFDLFIKYTAK